DHLLDHPVAEAVERLWPGQGALGGPLLPRLAEQMRPQQRLQSVEGDLLRLPAHLAGKLEVDPAAEDRDGIEEVASRRLQSLQTGLDHRLDALGDDQPLRIQPANGLDGAVFEQRPYGFDREQRIPLGLLVDALADRLRALAEQRGDELARG